MKRNQNIGENKMEKFKIVDYRYEDETYLVRILKKHNANITDWVEKDYGLLLDIEVLPENAADLKLELMTDRNFDIEY